LWSSADSRLKKAADEHGACARDEDCEVVEAPNGCLWSCSTAIARSGRSAYEATRRGADAVECKAWRDLGCLAKTPKAVPSCASVVARCRAGRCGTEIALPAEVPPQ
jgi:hypothetical protein